MWYDILKKHSSALAVVLILMLFSSCGSKPPVPQETFADENNANSQDSTESILKLEALHIYQRVISTLPDTVFSRLIDTCSISFLIRNKKTNEQVKKIDFTIRDRSPSISIPKELLDSGYKYYYSIFWIPNKIIQDREFQKTLMPREQMAVTMLQLMLRERRPGLTVHDSPFVNGLEYEEEFKPIFCTIKTKPAGANIFVIPRYEWDFYLKMPEEFTESSINIDVIKRLGDYKLSRPTLLDKLGLTETVYVVILEKDGKYILLKKFYPTKDNPAMNVIDQSFK